MAIPEKNNNIDNEGLLYNQQVDKSIFRAYDIRGVVDKNLTIDVVNKIGMALGTIVKRNLQNEVVIGIDGRLSGPKLAMALEEGILSTGCNVVNIGKVPTSILYYSINELNIPNGVIITGSHNPPDYNGLKIIVNNEAIYGEKISKIYEQIINNDFELGKGIRRQDCLKARYLQRIISDVKLNKKLKVVVDCGNGIAGCIAEDLYSSLGCEVIPLFCDVDGNFPNHHPDPAKPENLRDLIFKVKQENADIGLAFDGDADRVGVVDNLGNVICGDKLLMLFAKNILQKINLNNKENNKSKNANVPTVIYDVKCTNNVEKIVKEFGGNPIMWCTGHSLIKAKMKETNAILAAEMSGHIFIKERWYGFDDGLYAGARLLEIFSEQDKSVNEVFASFPENINTPEIAIELSDSYKFNFINKLIKEANFKDAEISTLDGMRVTYSYGWGLVRASNTTPSVVLRFEADTNENLNKIIKDFKDLISSVDDSILLTF